MRLHLQRVPRQTVGVDEEAEGAEDVGERAEPVIRRSLKRLLPHSPGSVPEWWSLQGSVPRQTPRMALRLLHRQKKQRTLLRRLSLLY